MPQPAMALRSSLFWTGPGLAGKPVRESAFASTRSGLPWRHAVRNSSDPGDLGCNMGWAVIGSDFQVLRDGVRAASASGVRELRENFWMALRGVRALVFDVFGTVVDWRSGVARQASPFLRRHGANSVDPLAFADAWRAGYQPAMEEVRSGRRPFTRLDVLHRENLETILPQFGIEPGNVPAAELDELNLAWHRLDPWPDVIAGLTRLKAGFVVAPLSNGNVILLLDMAKRAGLPWDAILGAEVVRAYKPTPEAYLRTADVLALRPEQVCLVAAHNGDLAAARDRGLRTAFVPRPTEHGPNQTTDTRPEEAWDVVARDFGALAEELGL
jgi:2-haloacid dehalogenase